MQHTALFFPDHEMSRTLDLEPQFLIVRNLSIEARQVLNTSTSRIVFSGNDQHGNRYLVRRASVPPPQERRAHSHHTLGNRTGRGTGGRRAPSAAK